MTTYQHYLYQWWCTTDRWVTIGAPLVGVTTVFHAINKIPRAATFIGMTTDLHLINELLQLINDLRLVSLVGADVQFTASFTASLIGIVAALLIPYPFLARYALLKSSLVCSIHTDATFTDMMYTAFCNDAIIILWHHALIIAEAMLLITMMALWLQLSTHLLELLLCSCCHVLFTSRPHKWHLIPWRYCPIRDVWCHTYWQCCQTIYVHQYTNSISYARIDAISISSAHCAYTIICTSQPMMCCCCIVHSACLVPPDRECNLPMQISGPLWA